MYSLAAATYISTICRQSGEKQNICRLPRIPFVTLSLSFDYVHSYSLDREERTHSLVVPPVFFLPTEYKPRYGVSYVEGHRKAHLSNRQAKASIFGSIYFFWRTPPGQSLSHATRKRELVNFFDRTPSRLFFSSLSKEFVRAKDPRRSFWVAGAIFRELVSE
jgi:hypothetical protein